MVAKQGVKARAFAARDRARPLVRPLARWGYAANGFVYVLVGLLAFRAAIGPTSADVTHRDALVALITEPFGQIVLVLIAIGLVGYSLGHLFMAIRKVEESEPKKVFDWGSGLGHAVSGVAHLGLAFLAIQVILTGTASGDDSTAEDWTAIVLSYQYGQWVIALVGVGILGVAAYILYKAYSAKFASIFDRSHMHLVEKQWLTVIGRIGLTARGIVYALIGIFVIRAAYRYDPSQAGGLGDALAGLATQPFGPWLLGFVAAGLMIYGLFGILLAHYRRFDI